MSEDLSIPPQSAIADDLGVTTTTSPPTLISDATAEPPEIIVSRQKLAEAQVFSDGVANVAYFVQESMDSGNLDEGAVMGAVCDEGERRGFERVKTAKEFMDAIQAVRLGRYKTTGPPPALRSVRKVSEEAASASSATQVPLATEEWRPPRSLPDGLRPVPTLPPNLIPPALRAWLCDIAERLQVPLDYPAAAVVVLMASLIGNQLRIRPKRRDDWTVTPNLWGAIVGRPGTMKTPAISEVFKPLYRLVKQAEEEFNERHNDFKFELEKLEIRKIAQREEMKKAAKKRLSLDGFAACSEDIEEPAERRYIVNDSTVEKQGEILNQNPNGILVFRDELTGWLRSLDDERRANDRAFHLESWNGGPYIFDRIGRGTLKIASTTTSIFGGIQPGPLAAYLRSALAFGGDDGLFQRFQVMVYPDAPREWRNIDRWPDTEAKNTAFATFERIANLILENAETDDAGSHLARFADEAQEFFNEWLTDVMTSLRSDAIEHPLLESHLTKYRKLMPSLALIFHLCDGTDNNVSLQAAQMAAAWCSYLWEHAQRIYGLALKADILNARTLAWHFQKGDLENGFTAREVTQKGWTGLATVEAVKEAIETLVLYGWLRSIETRNPAGGRPTVTYDINPRISEARL